MPFRKLDEAVSVSEQLAIEDVASAAAHGFRAIVNNRPDGEMPGQPTSMDMKQAAEAAGLAYRYIPIVPGRMDGDDIAQFGQAQDDLPGPILAFCRSGTRSATLWAAANARKLGVDEVLRAAANAGYDLSGARPLLDSCKG